MYANLICFVFWLVRRCVHALNFIDHSTVQIRVANVALAHNFSFSKQNCLVEFRVQMLLRDTRSCKLMSTPSKFDLVYTCTLQCSSVK